MAIINAEVEPQGSSYFAGGNPNNAIQLKPSCRRIHQQCGFAEGACKQCADCAFLDEGHFAKSHIEAFLRDSRASQEALEVPALAIASTVATILLTDNGRILDVDNRGQAFLKSRGIATVVEERLHWSDSDMQRRFAAAVQETAKTGKGRNLLYCHASHPIDRFGVILSKVKRASHETGVLQPAEFPIVCWLAPLDRRRFATARQLMELFELSPAEARLTRALCQGDSLEVYALDQGLKLPTLRSQLRAVFAKTGTDRQASLLRLIAGIPVMRDPS